MLRVRELGIGLHVLGDPGHAGPWSPRAGASAGVKS
jgi:hypothetical protein